MPRYIIHHDRYEFRGEKAYWDEFTGTIRELLLHLIDMGEEDSWELPNGDVVSVKDITTEEIEKLFHDANGDGQDYIMVYNADDRKDVFNNG